MDMNSEIYKKDIQKSKQLLSESDFVNKNGILCDKFSNRVEFDLYTNDRNNFHFYHDFDIIRHIFEGRIKYGKLNKKDY